MLYASEANNETHIREYGNIVDYPIFINDPLIDKNPISFRLDMGSIKSLINADSAVYNQTITLSLESFFMQHYYPIETSIQPPTIIRQGFREENRVPISIVCDEVPLSGSRALWYITQDNGFALGSAPIVLSGDDLPQTMTFRIGIHTAQPSRTTLYSTQYDGPYLSPDIAGIADERYFLSQYIKSFRCRFIVKRFLTIKDELDFNVPILSEDDEVITSLDQLTGMKGEARAVTGGGGGSSSNKPKQLTSLGRDPDEQGYYQPHGLFDDPQDYEFPQRTEHETDILLDRAEVDSSRLVHDLTSNLHKDFAGSSYDVPAVPKVKADFISPEVREVLKTGGNFVFKEGLKFLWNRYVDNPNKVPRPTEHEGNANPIANVQGTRAPYIHFDENDFPTELSFNEADLLNEFAESLFTEGVRAERDFEEESAILDRPRHLGRRTAGNSSMVNIIGARDEREIIDRIISAVDEQTKKSIKEAINPATGREIGRKVSDTISDVSRDELRNRNRNGMNITHIPTEGSRAGPAGTPTESYSAPPSYVGRDSQIKRLAPASLKPDNASPPPSTAPTRRETLPRRSAFIDDEDDDVKDDGLSMITRPTKRPAAAAAAGDEEPNDDFVEHEIERVVLFTPAEIGKIKRKINTLEKQLKTQTSQENKTRILNELAAVRNYRDTGGEVDSKFMLAPYNKFSFNFWP